MKIRFKVLSAFVLTFFSLSIILSARGFWERFSLKLTGGYGSMSVGDLNTVFEDLNYFYNSPLWSYGRIKEGEIKKLNEGAEFEGELIMNLTDNFCIGIGFGYISRKEKSKMHFVSTIDGWISSTTNSYEPEFYAIPIKLSAYYFLPITSKLDIYLNLGAGYYFGRINYLERVDTKFTFPVEIWYQQEMKLTDEALGLLGGVGFDFGVIKNISFFAELTGRYARLKDWKEMKRT